MTAEATGKELPTSALACSGAGPSRAAMEGGGVYNRNSAIQAAGGALASPLLLEAASKVPVAKDIPLVIADFGASQGRNSLLPLRTAITILRERAGTEKPISVVHTDLPENDFSTLFQLLESDPDSYLRHQPNVFTYAAGKSFYEPLFPHDHITLGWSSYALMWPSQLAALIPDHIYSTRSTGAVLDAFNKRGDEDWRRFLSLRANELRQGGRLVIVVAARDSQGLHGLELLMDHANAVLGDMVEEKRISAAERQRIVLPAHPKSLKDLMAPFERNGGFHGLIVEHCDVFAGPDPAWEAFRQNRDSKTLAISRAGFFRAAFGPTFASALDNSRTSAQRVAFSDRLEQGLVSRVTKDPTEMRLVIGTMVIAKQ